MTIHSSLCTVFYMLLQHTLRITLGTFIIWGVNFNLCAADPIENSINFKAKPSKCVALHKGQTCYQKITLTWSALPPGEYCLTHKTTIEPLTCWKGSNLTQYHWSFESNQSETLNIYDNTKKLAVGHVKIKLATVYKHRKKSHGGWRLF